MNDRFKFRFWYKPKNRYINTEKLVLNDGTYTQVGTKQMNNGTYCSYIVNEYNSSDVIPEQCTGLKDKNGKLIYEGDILRSESYPFKSDNEYHYAAEVCFDEESAVFFYYVFRTSTKVAGRAEGNTGELNECDWEIIGNIHENADLIKVGEK